METWNKRYFFYVLNSVCHTGKSRLLDGVWVLSVMMLGKLCILVCNLNALVFLSLPRPYLLRWGMANIIANKGVYILICLCHSSQHSETPFKHPFSLVKGDHLKTNRPHKKSRVSKFL